MSSRNSYRRRLELVEAARVAAKQLDTGASAPAGRAQYLLLELSDLLAGDTVWMGRDGKLYDGHWRERWPTLLEKLLYLFLRRLPRHL